MTPGQIIWLQWGSPGAGVSWQLPISTAQLGNSQLHGACEHEHRAVTCCMAGAVSLSQIPDDHPFNRNVQGGPLHRSM